MAFGALVYGEIFGFHLEELGIHVESVFPMFSEFGVKTEGVLLSISASFILGYILMFFAFLAKVYNLSNRGEADIAFLLTLPQTVMYFALGMMFFGLMSQALPMPQFLLDVVRLPWVYVFLFSLAFSVAGAIFLKLKYRGYEEVPPIGEELVIGTIESIFGALANIPSFSRLVILVLIHGVLTKLVNIAAISVGMPTGIIVAVLGHALIASSEGLFSLVQTLRLAFYETLSKFYEGRGRLFTPVFIP